MDFIDEASLQVDNMAQTQVPPNNLGHHIRLHLIITVVNEFQHLGSVRNIFQLTIQAIWDLMF